MSTERERALNPFLESAVDGTGVSPGHPQAVIEVTPEAGTGHQFHGHIATMLYMVGGDGDVGFEDQFGRRVVLPVLTASTHLYFAGSFRRVYSRSNNDIKIFASFSQNPVDVNDEPPVFTSAATATAIPENTEVPATQTLYTAAATPDVTGEEVVYSIVAGQGNGDEFEINSSTGVVTFRLATTPDFEEDESYTFTVRATVGDQSVDLVVTLPVTDVAGA